MSKIKKIVISIVMVLSVSILCLSVQAQAKTITVYPTNSLNSSKVKAVKTGTTSIKLKPIKTKDELQIVVFKATKKGTYNVQVKSINSKDGGMVIMAGQTGKKELIKIAAGNEYVVALNGKTAKFNVKLKKNEKLYIFLGTYKAGSCKLSIKKK